MANYDPKIKNVSALIDHVTSIARHIKSVRDLVFWEASRDIWIELTRSELKDAFSSEEKHALQLSDVCITWPPSHPKDRRTKLPDDLTEYLPKSPMRDLFGSVYGEPIDNGQPACPVLDSPSEISLGLQAARDLVDDLKTRIELFPRMSQFQLASATTQYLTWHELKSKQISIPAHGFVVDLNYYYLLWKKVEHFLINAESQERREKQSDASNSEKATTPKMDDEVSNIEPQTTNTKRKTRDKKQEKPNTERASPTNVAEPSTTETEPSTTETEPPATQTEPPTNEQQLASNQQKDYTDEQENCNIDRATTINKRETSSSFDVGTKAKQDAERSVKPNTSNPFETIRKAAKDLGAPDVKSGRGKKRLELGQQRFKAIIPFVLKAHVKEALSLNAETLAKAIGCSVSTLEKHPAFKEFKKQYAKQTERYRIFNPEITQEHLGRMEESKMKRSDD